MPRSVESFFHDGICSRVVTEFSLDRNGIVELINMKRRFNDGREPAGQGVARARARTGAMPINSFHNFV